MLTRTHVFAGIFGISCLLGCDPERSPVYPARAESAAPQTRAIKFWEASTTARWNALARDLVVRNRPNQQVTLRLFAYLTLAQYNAIVAAEDAKSSQTRPSARGAIAGASAVVLRYVFPGEAAFLDERVRAEKAAPTWPGENRTDFEAGEAVGRSVAGDVVAHARTDRFGDVWTGTVPVCVGCWFSSLVPAQPPLLPLLGRMRPFFLASGDQFRPAPPPAFGSPEFRAALDEVRRISDTRTEEQTRIANFWAMTTGSLVGGFWNEQATGRIERYRLTERRAAHALALMHMTAMDANIACHDGKYTYWVMRPSQADPLIRLAIGLPNHPSYPGNHACVSGAAARILAALFPSESDRLLSMADEAAISRVYGGIHYRFDGEAGLRIAEQVSQLALQLDVRGHRPFPLRTD